VERGDSGGLSSTTGAQFGKYKIVRRLGEGAFGVVYEALLPGPMGFTKRVAIKLLRSYLVRDDPRFVQSMVNEARIGGLLHHANIVDILEFGQEGQNWYLAMEFVEGPTLSEILRLCRDRKALLPRFVVVDLTQQICRGLHHAHEFKDSSGRSLSLIHRDLKPSNIIVDRSGITKVCDFGIAKAASNLYNTTTSGMVKGTPRYMSPEQIGGERALDRRSDLFSLGVILFEVITGRVLYDAGSLPALIHQIAYEDTSSKLDEAEAAFPGSRALLRRLLALNRDDRYPDAMALSDNLRDLGRAYPAEAEMSEVVQRLLPAVDRTGTTDIGSTGDLGLDHSAGAVDDEATKLAPISEFTPIPAAAPTSGGWERFSEVFDASAEPPPPPTLTPAPAPPRGTESPTPDFGLPTATADPMPDPAAASLDSARTPAVTSADWDSQARGGSLGISRWLVFFLAGSALLLVGLLGGLLVTSFMDGGLGRLGASRTTNDGAATGPGEETEIEEEAPAGKERVAGTEMGTEMGMGMGTEMGTETEMGTGDVGILSESVQHESKLDAVAVAGETPGEPDPAAAVANEPVEGGSEAAPPPAEADDGDVDRSTERDRSEPQPEETAERKPGTISVRSFPWAQFYVDDVSVGKGANILKLHPVTGGAHTVRLVCTMSGNQEKVYRVEVDGDDVDLGCWDFDSETPTCRQRRASP